jgi:NAD(P)H-dependent FMN reductase
MIKLLGISGSLRKKSFNSGLLRAAKDLLPPDASLDVADLSNIPVYNADIETGPGIPEPVTVLKEAISACDGLLLATPEYNNSIPGVLKNAIDWASRPSADIPRIFRGRNVALIGASPGGFGTILAQTAWLPVFRTLGMHLWTGARLMVPGAGKAFDQDGNLIDEDVREKLRKLLSSYVDSLRDR